jgi:hypothetical protein
MSQACPHGFDKDVGLFGVNHAAHTFREVCRGARRAPSLHARPRPGSVLHPMKRLRQGMDARSRWRATTESKPPSAGPWSRHQGLIPRRLQEGEHRPYQSAFCVPYLRMSAIPATINVPPAICPMRSPFSAAFSTRTKSAIPAIQNRFMTPATNRRTMSSQQHATQ